MIILPILISPIPVYTTSFRVFSPFPSTNKPPSFFPGNHVRRPAVHTRYSSTQAAEEPTNGRHNRRPRRQDEEQLVHHRLPKDEALEHAEAPECPGGAGPELALQPPHRKPKRSLAWSP